MKIIVCGPEQPAELNPSGVRDCILPPTRRQGGMVLGGGLPWLLAGALVGLTGVCATAAERLTKEQRAQMERRLLELNRLKDLYYPPSLPMYQRLSPYAYYNPYQAGRLNNLGFELHDRGEYARALEYYQQALAMDQRLYPKAKYPQGHADLANSLNNLGVLLHDLGEYARALDYLKQALAMRRRLYPEAKYPPGHPDLAASLNNLGDLLQSQGEYARALDYLKQALAMKARLYPKAKFSEGHPALATSLHNLGALLQTKGEYARALDYFKEALAMRQRLYPKAKYPEGHPDLALSLNYLGALLQAKGDYVRALDYFKEALAMRQRLYPKAEYPLGHPDLALSLHNQGSLLEAKGKYAGALDYFKQALAMRQDLSDQFGTAASEAEAFSLAASLPLTLDGLLSVSLHLTGTDETSYGYIWRCKAAITRILERRQQALVQFLVSENLTEWQRKDVAKLWQQLLDKRRALARFLLAPTREAKPHRERLQQLSQEKIELEQQLVKLLPDFPRQQELRRQKHDALVKKLPADTAFIDLLRYVRSKQNPKLPGKVGERRTESYVAFILSKDQPVHRVELDQAGPIEQALEAWRTGIRRARRGSPDPAAHELRNLLWEPLAKHIPSGIKTILIAPDGALSRLPWAALPVNQEGRVLLEDYAVAFVPHGPYLLERLGDRKAPAADTGRLVAVGAVPYDAKPQATKETKVSPNLVLNRAAERGDRKLTWKDLPGTAKEVDQVVALAGKRTLHRLTGAEANTTRLLAELPQARWVHLATHGFFADKKFRSILQIDEKLFDRRAFREGPAPGARNPLVLSGLVLAGANLPLPENLKERLESDGGILTAEAIAGLPLQRLELSVLSACETGLGEVAGGEGVFGLQRAFHMAGAKNVVASLWKVDDEATAALMALFYDKLWRQKKPAIVALREAQLTLYHHPERIGALAKERGPNFDKVVRLPVKPARAKELAQGGMPATKLWAGFVLSGLGR